jgi:prophage maintenance system killer protein
MRYLSLEDVIEINKQGLEEVKVSRADRHGILMGDYGRAKIRRALGMCKSARGDIYQKAAALLIGLTNQHGFESGNRRTGYLAAVEFLDANGFEVVPAYDIEVMRGVRARTYKRAQVAAWLKGHGI